MVMSSCIARLVTAPELACMVIRMLRFLFCLGLTWAVETPLQAQPWRQGTPSGAGWSPLSNRHPAMPALDSLFRVAPDAERTVLPTHGGVNREGRPVWGHQVRRVHQTDTTRAYTGWIRQILVDSDHRWRFQRFEQGWLVEQVGYYADGTADHHFHTDTTGRNIGSQRMWRADGSPYLDQFHDENGDLHDRQMRWNADGSVDWNAQFDHGTEVDAHGRRVPEAERTFPSSGNGC